MKIIITIIAFLTMGITYADNSPQRVCVSIDKNAKNSGWTRRDNTAKLRFLAKYGNWDAIGSSDLLKKRLKDVSSNPSIELRYGQPAVCQNVPVPHVQPGQKDRWIFMSEIKVGVQYGGDCSFNYNSNRTFNVTIHHRRGDLVNPWSCTVK